jgi:hypothetical protein
MKLLIVQSYPVSHHFYGKMRNVSLNEVHIFSICAACYSACFIGPHVKLIIADLISLQLHFTCQHYILFVFR